MKLDFMQMFNQNPQPNPLQQQSASPSGGGGLTPEQQQQQNANLVPDAFKGTNVDDPSKVKSPLDEFEGLFKIQEGSANLEDDFTKPIFNFDADKLGTAASSINFAQGIDPEVAQKALSGDAQSLQAMLNQVGKNAFLQAAQLNTSLVEKGLNQRFEQFNKILPGRIRDANVSESVFADNSFKHEAVRPVIDALKGQFSKSYPNASPAQITDMVKKYFSAVAGSSTQQADKQKSQQPPQADFADFFGSN